MGSGEKYLNITHYRIDRITDISMTEFPVRPIKEIKGSENGLNLPRHMAEHVYMFRGESIPVQLKVNTGIINDLVDWFGKDFRIIEKDEAEHTMVISVKCNYNAMFYWALQYGAYVEVLFPAALRSELADTVRAMNEKYSRK